jgi:hypothetical protein
VLPNCLSPLIVAASLGIGTAILDRLPHHCRVVNIKGHSYRLRGHGFSKNDFATAGTAAPVVENGKTDVGHIVGITRPRLRDQRETSLAGHR